MTQLFKTFLFQLISIIIFGCLYWIYRDDFTLNFVIGKKKNDIRILDCLYTSVTIQAGVGYSILNPHTNRSVLLLMIQQLNMIFANILMLYFFSMYFVSSKRIHL
jgi:hypothetical protein